MMNDKESKKITKSHPGDTKPVTDSNAPTHSPTTSIDGDDLHLPIRPWNANVKAYTKQEPSIPWYKKQSRVPRESDVFIDGKSDKIADEFHQTIYSGSKKNVSPSPSAKSNLNKTSKDPNRPITPVISTRKHGASRSPAPSQSRKQPTKNTELPSSETAEMVDVSFGFDSVYEKGDSIKAGAFSLLGASKQSTSIEKNAAAVPTQEPRKDISDKTAMQQESDTSTNNLKVEPAPAQDRRRSLGAHTMFTSADFKSFSKSLSKLSDEDSDDHDSDDFNVDEPLEHKISSQPSIRPNLEAEKSFYMGQIYDTSNEFSGATPNVTTMPQQSTSAVPPSRIPRPKAVVLLIDGQSEEHGHRHDIDAGHTHIPLPRRQLPKQKSSIKYEDSDLFQAFKARHTQIKAQSDTLNVPKPPVAASSASRSPVADISKGIFNRSNPLQSHTHGIAGQNARNHIDTNTSHSGTSTQDANDSTENDENKSTSMRLSPLTRQEPLSLKVSFTNDGKSRRAKFASALALIEGDEDEENDDVNIKSKSKRGFDENFEPLSACLFCKQQISALPLSEQLPHVRICYESYQKNMETFLARNGNDSKNGQTGGSELEEAYPVVRLGMRSKSKSMTGSRRMKSKCDVGTQTMGALVDFDVNDPFKSGSFKTPKVDPIVEKQTEKLSKDLSFKVNKINERRSDLLKKMLTTDDIAKELADVHHFPAISQDITSITDSQVSFPKPSLMSHAPSTRSHDVQTMNDPTTTPPAPEKVFVREKSVLLTREKSKRLNLVGPATVEATAGPENDAKEVERLKDELQDLLAKLSVFRLKERVLRSAIKKRSDKLRSEPVAAKSVSAVVEEEVPEHLAKYRRMLKMIPVQAVVGRMTVEGINAEEQAFVLKILDAPVAEKGSAKEKSIEKGSLSKEKPVEPEKSVEVGEQPLPEHLQKYKKMLKMLPEPAVINRMTIEGISQDDQNLVLGKGPPPAPTPLEIVVPEHLQKYKKMLKMMPEPAVVNRMTIDGISPSDQNIVLGIAPPPPPVEIPVPEHLMKYKKMLKMMPEAAVVGRMTIDGISADDQNIVLGKGSPSVEAPKEIELPEHLKKYQVMLKRLPEAAVVGRMTIEGISAEDQKLVLSSLKPAAAANSPAAPIIPKKPAGPKLTGLFWETIDSATIMDSDRDNMWKILYNSKPSSELSGAEYESLVALFTKKDPVKAKKEKEEAAAALAKAEISASSMSTKSGGASEKPKKKTAKVLTADRFDSLFPCLHG